MTIEFNTQEYIPTQKRELEEKINKILDDYMEPLYNATVIDEIKSLAKASNLPQSFIDGVKFRRTAPNQGEVINTWGTKEKPLAKWFNDGTKAHWIAPLKKVLSWLSKAGSHASAIFYQGGTKPGTRLFSKGHYVSGIAKTEVMEKGYQLGKKRLSVEAAKIVESELENE